MNFMCLSIFIFIHCSYKRVISSVRAFYIHFSASAVLFKPLGLSVLIADHILCKQNSDTPYWCVLRIFWYLAERKKSIKVDLVHLRPCLHCTGLA